MNELKLKKEISQPSKIKTGGSTFKNQLIKLKKSLGAYRNQFQIIFILVMQKFRQNIQIFL